MNDSIPSAQPGNNLTLQTKCDSSSNNSNIDTNTDVRRARSVICCSNVSKPQLKVGYEFVGHISLVALFLFLLFLLLRLNGSNTSLLTPFWSLSLLWLSSMTGGMLINSIGLPPLLGMITVGIVLSSLIDTFDIPESWSETATSSGLAIILVRSGLELDAVGTLRDSGFVTMRLTCIPGCAEAIACGLASILIFDMPLSLALSLGFILAAVSPAIVVVEMLKLQRLRLGGSIPSLVMAAASFDDVVAIAGFSVCIGLAITSKKSSLIQTILHGPLSLFLGVAIGVLCGIFLSLTKLWNRPWKRTVMITCLALSVMFGMKALSFPGSGAVGSITAGITASHCWSKGVPKRFADTADSSFTHETEKHLSLLWTLVFEPLLFGVIGAGLDFDLIPGKTVVKSLIIVTIGISVRLPVAYIVTGGNGYTAKERAFISIAWLPKATVQAALCSFPLVLAKNILSKSDDSYARYMLWGNEILSTAIISIIVTAPLGLVLIQYLAPRWLSVSEYNGEEEEDQA